MRLQSQIFIPCESLWLTCKEWVSGLLYRSGYEIPKIRARCPYNGNFVVQVIFRFPEWSHYFLLRAMLAARQSVKRPFVGPVAIATADFRIHFNLKKRRADCTCNGGSFLRRLDVGVLWWTRSRWMLYSIPCQGGIWGFDFRTTSTVVGFCSRTLCC